MFIFNCKTRMWNWHARCTLRLKGEYHIVCVNELCNICWETKNNNNHFYASGIHCTVPHSVCIEYIFKSIIMLCIRLFYFTYECIEVKFTEWKEPWYFIHIRIQMHYSVDKETTCKANDGTLKMNAKLNSFQVSGRENLSCTQKTYGNWIDKIH